MKLQLNFRNLFSFLTKVNNTKKINSYFYSKIDLETNKGRIMIKAQRGTKDIIGDEILTWQWILENAKNVFQNACFTEIKTPIFEATELFAPRL